MLPRKKNRIQGVIAKLETILFELHLIILCVCLVYVLLFMFVLPCNWHHMSLSLTPLMNFTLSSWMNFDINLRVFNVPMVQRIFGFDFVPVGSD